MQVNRSPSERHHEPTVTIFERFSLRQVTDGAQLFIRNRASSVTPSGTWMQMRSHRGRSRSTIAFQRRQTSRSDKSCWGFNWAKIRGQSSGGRSYCCGRTTTLAMAW
uniref:(northern house mosquito) hypothetical protein n=1 Tax=Culex pipiens TaxID=7175 RepID=A0A8D8ACK4_CULPI